jgi:ribosome-associated translation inhibitor RaiA
MNIEVRTDNHIDGNARMIDYVRAQLNSEFSRYSERLTHIEVHFSDTNAEKGGDDDKRCAIEAKAAGFKAIAVTHKAPNLDLALDGAIEKLHHSFEHTFAKLNEHRHVSKPTWEDLDVAQE